ncbi:hypothetical protein D9M68_928450 [compost metagenome]
MHDDRTALRGGHHIGRPQRVALHPFDATLLAARHPQPALHGANLPAPRQQQAGHFPTDAAAGTEHQNR